MLGLKHMGELALEQVKDVLNAYSERNADKALRVWRKDTDPLRTLRGAGYVFGDNF